MRYVLVIVLGSPVAWPRLYQLLRHKTGVEQWGEKNDKNRRRAS